MTDELEKLKADNAALREVLNEMAGKFGGSVQVGSLYHQAQTLLSTEHPGAEILRERDELRAEVERLRKRLEIIDGHEEFDGIACRDETIRQLESEVERLRGLVAHLEEQVDSQYDEAVTTAEPDWRTHDSDQPPADLAPAQLVDCEYLFTNCKTTERHRASAAPWKPGLRYRPALSTSGLPLVSAEGLKEWAAFVAVNKSASAWQFDKRPQLSPLFWAMARKSRPPSEAPATHAKPGPWTESLMEVAR